MDQRTKNCPFCGEQILAEAKKCRYCGEFLPGDGEANGTSPRPPAARSPFKNWGVIVMMVAIVSAIIVALLPTAPSTGEVEQQNGSESAGVAPATAQDGNPSAQNASGENGQKGVGQKGPKAVQREEVKPVSAPPPAKQIVRRRLEPEATRRLSETPQLIKTTITTTGRGSKSDWGLEYISSFVLNYVVVCEARIVEKSETAAGEVKVVEERRYLQASQDLQLSKTDVKVAIAKTVDLDKVDALTSVIGGAVDWVGGLFGEPAMGDFVREGMKEGVKAIVGSVDGLDANGIYQLASNLGLAPDTADAKKNAELFLDNLAKDIFKTSELQGKAYRITYYQDKDSGEPLRVDLAYADGQKIKTADEWMVLRRANAFIDAQIIPNRSCSPGDSWTVDAADFDCLFDPYVDGKYQGQVSIDRQANDANGNWMLHLSPSDVNMVSDQGRATGSIHLAEGKAMVDGKHDYVKAMEVVGSGAMKNLNEHHLLFKARMEGLAEFRALLACEPAK